MMIKEDELRRMLEQTLLPPTNVTELDPNSVESATIRFNNVKGSISESYQVNSALNRRQLLRLADAQEARIIQEFYYKTAQDGYDTLSSENPDWVLPLAEAPSWVKEVISPLSRSGFAAASLFSCDLMVVFEERLWRLIPGREGFQFEGTWGLREDNSLRKAIGYSAPDDLLGTIIIANNLARSSYVIGGDRAFRSSSISCGAILGMLQSSIGRPNSDISLQATSRFLDNEANEASRCDGMERCVQVIVTVRQTRKPSESER
jgi:hypothetical protein